jgi:hypothetical protein
MARTFIIAWSSDSFESLILLSPKKHFCRGEGRVRLRRQGFDPRMDLAIRLCRPLSFVRACAPDFNKTCIPISKELKNKKGIFTGFIANA